MSTTGTGDGGPTTRWIDRPRLVSDHVLEPGSVHVLVAPAGSGKSVLLTQTTEGCSAAWLTVTAAHNDAMVFARDLVESLAGARDEVDPTVTRLLPSGGRGLGPAFVDAMRTTMERLDEPAVIVLDDLHNLTNVELLADVEALLLAAPRPAAVLVGSRWDPPFRLGRLRVEGSATELRAADLAFDGDEADQLVARIAGVTLERPLIGALVERTEGWAAGLQLAALSLQRGVDPERFVKGFAGNDRLVVDYLTGEVLDAQPHDLRRFLLHTSILEWMTPSLCDAVTGDDNGAAMLAALAERGLFVSPLVGDGQRIRYHHLFAELLRYQFRAEDRDGKREARKRAATWLLEHGELRDGVEQLLAAGAFDLAFEVIDGHGMSFFERGEIATLARWLVQIQRAGTAPEPATSISLLAAQSGGDEFMAAEETHRRLLRRRGITPGEQIAIDTLASLAGYGDLPTSEMRRLARRAIDQLADVDRSTVFDFFGGGGADSCETIANFMEALGAFYDGDVDASTTALERTLELPGTRYPIWSVACSGALAFCHAWSGRLTDAHRLARATIDAAQDMGTVGHASATLSLLAAAAVSLDRAELLDARRHLDAAGAILQRSRRTTNRHLHHLLDARLVGLTDGPGPALDHLRRLDEPGALRPVTVQARLTTEIGLLLRAGATQEAVALIQRSAAATPAALIDVHLAADELRAARKVLDRWQPVEPTLRTQVDRLLREGAVLAREGKLGPAGIAVADAAVLAEPELLVSPFLDVPTALDLLRDAAPARPLRRLRALVDATPDHPNRQKANEQLVEPLTARELAVLDHLPSRLSNAEMAETLYISVNTLKSHVRSIYRKLASADRDEAVHQARQLGLL